MTDKEIRLYNIIDEACRLCTDLYLRRPQDRVPIINKAIEKIVILSEEE